MKGSKWFPPMPIKVKRESPISLWNTALEIHTGRIYQPILGEFYILVVPVVGLFALEISVIGYRAVTEGEAIVFQLGFSHPIRVSPPPGITITVARGGRALTVEGNDKESVGEVAARIRAFRKPDPYKGKGIRYAGEVVRRKAGKAGRIGGL